LKNFILNNKLFVICIILVSGWYVDVWENSNSCSRVLPIATFFERGDFVLNKYKDKTIDISMVNGNYYMDKAPLPTMLTLPFFGLIKLLGMVHSEQGSYYGRAVYISGAFICGILPFLWIMFMLIKTLVSQQREHLVLMAVVALLSSFVFVFSGTFFAHVLAAACCLMAYIFFEKEKYFWVGIFCGLSFLTEYTTVWIFIAWLFIDAVRNKKIVNVLLALIGFAPSLLFILCYNYYFTGSPFKMLYLFVADNFVVAEKSTYGLSFPKLKAIHGLLFSESRGILFYAPVLIYAIYNLFTDKLMLAQIRVKSLLLHPILLPFLLTLLFISSHAAWEGGWSYGPRHLMAVSVLLIYCVIQSASFGKNKFVFWFTCCYGFVCTMLAKLTVLYSVPELQENILTYLISKRNDAYNDGNILSLLSGQSAIHGFYGMIVFVLLIVLTRPKQSTLLSNSKS
jgi:hypothetical protein